MTIRRVVLSFCVVTLAVPLVTAQDQPRNSAPAMSPEQTAAMMKMISPGEPHKSLARMAGDWTVSIKSWMAPGQPPAESSGTMHAQTLMGGRYVESTWKGSIMGMDFEGRGTDGYDNVARQYISSWVDNMGTGILYQTGSCTADHKTCTYTGDVWDPATGQKSAMKSVISWLDDNTFRNEIFGRDPSGAEMKMIEITAKRR